MSEKLPEPQEIMTDATETVETGAGKRGKPRNRGILISTVIVLIMAVAAAVLAAYIWMPVFQIYGKSMEPTLAEDEYVVAVSFGKIRQGDVIAFQVNNKILIKRVIGVGGDEVHIADDGTVTVNNRELEEPYIHRKHDGAPDIANPCQVPAGEYFVMGDSREVSVDSRHSAVGCVTEGQIVGKLILKIWPMSEFGLMK